MLIFLLSLLMISESYQVSMLDTHSISNAIPTTKPMRKKKAPNILHIHPLLVSHLHVIPLHTVHTVHTHTVHTEINVVNTHHNTTGSQLIPLLIPHTLIHNVVPVHDLSVIPLSQPKSFVDEGGYRNPLGGYGVGWSFGGHGAGHGFHYSYG